MVIIIIIIFIVMIIIIITLTCLQPSCSMISGGNTREANARLNSKIITHSIYLDTTREH